MSPRDIVEAIAEANKHGLKDLVGKLEKLLMGGSTSDVSDFEHPRPGMPSSDIVTPISVSRESYGRFLRDDLGGMGILESKYYKKQEPFPHTIIDGACIAEKLDEVVSALPLIPEEMWNFDEHESQQKKSWTAEVEKLPAPIAAIMREFNSPRTLNMLEKITGISGLIADPNYIGGGVHRVQPGGRLAIHSDFNLHPDTGNHRRLNVLLYLNHMWDPTWGGDLEFWTSDMSRCARKIDPVFNRMVVFNINDYAFHGHPEPLKCPENRNRYALAFYYYTQDRPEYEKGPFHWANWQKRPGSSKP